MPAPLRLKVGLTYLSREGKRVRVTERNKSETPFVCDDGASRDGRGSLWGGWWYGKTNLDLIRLAPPLKRKAKKTVKKGRK